MLIYFKIKEKFELVLLRYPPNFKYVRIYLFLNVILINTINLFEKKKNQYF